MLRTVLVMVVLVGSTVSVATAQDLDTARRDQIDRLKSYVLDAILPSGLVRDSLVLNGSSFHPATPDAAGFALLGLSALDHLGELPDAEQRVVNVLSAYAGQTSGVVPARSTDRHFIHLKQRVFARSRGCMGRHGRLLGLLFRPVSDGGSALPVRSGA